ncbi:MAG: CotH kinase family protein, partial [Saprospiraceae bacterium]|nr:CotH kinase family protein [Saprospiraceae bacterium]
VASKEMHTRGKTTLKFWRKSYTVELRDSFTFAGPNSTKEMDHFYLISMSLDRYYYHNELAFRCLAKVGLFPLWYHLTELKINGQSEGLYLIVQRPADFVLKDLGSSAIIRRSSTEFIAKEKYSKQTSEDIRKICRDHFHDIRKSGKRWEGEILYDSLQSYLVLDHYFSWLNFNYLVQNGDYTDELFYYLMPSVTPVRFDIIPWDFDDILVKNPHEGAEVRKSRLSDQLLFSSEDALDLIIARDPYLYKKYLENFDFVLDHLNPGAMENIFNEIKDDLRPYLEKEEIVLASQHDYHPVENWKEASAHMGRILNFLKKRWSETRTEVKKQLRRS